MKNNLNTTEEIKTALSKVAEMMEQEVFTHGTKESFYHNHADSKYNFNQGISASVKHDCGTVACIGGWCWLLNNEEPIQETDTNVKYCEDAIERADNFVEGDYCPRRPEGLHKLFYPFFDEIDGLEHLQYKDVTPKHAAKAIRNYIESDNPDWKNVMTDVREGE